MLLLAKIKQLICIEAGVCMFGMELPPGCVESQPPNFQGFVSGMTHDVLNFVISLWINNGLY